MQLVVVRYAGPNADEPNTRVLCPYGILYGKRGWLVADVDELSDMRLWRLDRIISIDLLDRGFARRAKEAEKVHRMDRRSVDFSRRRETEKRAAERGRATSSENSALEPTAKPGKCEREALTSQPHPSGGDFVPAPRSAV